MIALSYLLLGSRDFVVGKLLTCSPDRFSYWLEYHDQSPEVTETLCDVSFSGADVCAFEKLCATMDPSSADVLAEDFTGHDDIDEEEYEPEWNYDSSSSTVDSDK